MIIHDPVSNKPREVRDLKVVLHEESKSVQMTVVGLRHTWPLAIPYDDFVSANKGVPLP